MYCVKYMLMFSWVHFCVYSINRALFFSTNLCVWPRGMGIFQECKVGFTVNSWQLTFFDCKCLTLSFWLLRYPLQRHLCRRRKKKKQGISRKFQSIWHSAAFRGWLDGTAVPMKRRHDLKGSCWSVVLQIKSKQALCNSLLCFYFFLVLYCCLSFPNTINASCQLHILNPNAIVFSPRIWHLLLLVHGKEGKWEGGRVVCTCANVSLTLIFTHYLIPTWQQGDKMTSKSFRSYCDGVGLWFGPIRFNPCPCLIVD